MNQQSSSADSLGIPQQESDSKFRALILQKRALQRKKEEISQEREEIRATISKKEKDIVEKSKECEKKKAQVMANLKIPEVEKDLPTIPKSPLYGTSDTQGRTFEWYDEGRSAIVSWTVQKKEITPEQILARQKAKKEAEERRQQQINTFVQVSKGIGKSIYGDLEKIVDVVTEKTGEEFERQTKEKNLEFKEKKNYIVTFVGDASIGKSSLLKAYLKQPFSDEYQPTTFNTQKVEVSYYDDTVGKQSGIAEIWDTGNTPEIEKKLYACFKTSHCVALCFSLVDYDSYLHLVKWKQMIDAQSSVENPIPTVLVGLKSDLLDSAQLARTGQSGFYSFRSASNYAKQLGCSKFELCSSKNNDGITEVWNEIILWKYFNYIPRSKTTGSILDRVEKKKEKILPYQNK